MRKTETGRHTPVAFARAILMAYARRGIDPGSALLQAGITDEDLCHPDGRIAIEPFEALSSLAMRDLDDEALGWFSRPLPWGSYGMILRASLPSPTLGVALRRWCRHHGLLTQDVRLDLQVEGTFCVIRVEECADLGALREFCLVALLRNFLGVASWMTDSRIAPLHAQFPFSAPAHSAAYDRMFLGRTDFDAPNAGLRFDAVYLDLPIIRDDAALRRLLERPVPLMARQYRRDRLLSQRIISFYAENATSIPNAEATARHFNISVRSLQRHLQEEGFSIHALSARARRSQAEDLLRRGDLPLKRVARLLGYRDESTFGRAFRRWTGQTPDAFRRQ